jgi:Ca-activated chloride channel family protein
MSRHALHSPRRRSRKLLPFVLIAVLALVLASGAIARFGVGPASVTTALARAPVIGADCPDKHLSTTAVAVTVAPELLQTVTAALAPLRTSTLPGRECVITVIQAQEPVETVEGAQVLPLDRTPDVWIPDSSLWLSRVPRWPVTEAASFARSPVVIATSQATLTRLGWVRRAPTWAEAMAGKTPVAVPTLPASAPGLSAVIAMWRALGKKDVAQQAPAAAVLAAGRAGVPTEQEALAAAESGSRTAPLLPISEQAVAAANAKGRSELMSVKPSGGSPYLDYPVYIKQRSTTAAAGRRSRAVRLVVEELQNARSQGLVKAAGFEVVGQGVATAGYGAGTSPDLPAKELAELVGRITALSAPSRVLVIFDLSGSMRAPAGNGMTRIQFAGVAAKAAGDLMTDRAQTGLWGFSRDLDGTKDIVDLVNVAPLGQMDGKLTHRQTMDKAMSSTATRVGGNGTALYKTAVAGMKRMNELYDPRAGNAVVLFTDGANFDPGGPTLKQTTAQLERLYNPRKPVRLVCIGIGSGADMAELARLTRGVDGLAYLATTPAALPKVLFEAMNRRT